MIGTIRAKIIWTFSILVVLNLAAGFWAISNFYAMGRTVATILRENYNSVRAAENMVTALERQDNALLFLSEGEDEPIGGDFDANKESFFYWYDQVVRTQPPVRELPLLDSIQAAYRLYATVADSMRARVAQGAFLDAKDYHRDAVRPVSNRLREMCFALFGLNQDAMFNAEARTHSIAGVTAYGTMMASLVSLLLSVVAAGWLLRSVIHPAEKLTDRVRQIGKGRLDLKTDVVSNDEIGEMSREFNKMTERLRRFEQLNIEQILAEKRKSEGIVGSIPDVLVVTDAAMRIVHVNAAAAALFSLDERTAVGSPVSAAIPDERILALLRGQGAQAQAPRDLQFERGGSVVHYRPRVSPISDAGGARAGEVLLLQDVTQFKELDRMKSEFIATLSHEFKTPLTSINMSIDILNQSILGPLNDRQRTLVGAAREDCQRLTRLSRELLQLSKLEAGRMQFRDEELTVRAVMEFSLQPLQLQFREKGVALDSHVEEGLPVLFADQQQLSWVIANLVANALKYTDAGGSVDVRARASGGDVLFEVADTGRGIAPEHLDRIFDKFVQIRDTGGTAAGSVGLGLAIAKEIVGNYGGRIWAESVPGRGSTFRFTIPGGRASHRGKGGSA
jgi:PAS domain S-box-containing protein